MNLIADLLAVEERIEQVRDRNVRQEAIIRRLRQLNALPCVMDAVERLHGVTARNAMAMLAHRDAIASALEKYSHVGVLCAMQAGLAEQHCDVDDLPVLI